MSCDGTVGERGRGGSQVIVSRWIVNREKIKSGFNGFLWELNLSGGAGPGVSTVSSGGTRTDRLKMISLVKPLLTL